MPNQAVAQRFMADGPSVERSILRRDCNLLVAKLVKDAPADKSSTVRRLLADARTGKVDREVFKEFVRRTDSFSLVEEIFNWEKYQKDV